MDASPATILREAEAELLEAAEYYESRCAGLGQDFLTDAASCVEAIENFPDRWPLRRDGTRRCLIHRFPYLVIYTIVEGKLWIVAFAHCKRRQEYWSSRLERLQG